MDTFVIKLCTFRCAWCLWIGYVDDIGNKYETVSRFQSFWELGFIGKIMVLYQAVPSSQNLFNGDYQELYKWSESTWWSASGRGYSLESAQWN